MPACVSKSGISFPIRAPFGPKHCPSIFQGKMDHELNHLVDFEHAVASQEPICVVATDDFKVSSKAYPSHVRQATIVLQNGEKIGAEFKLDKCSFRRQ